MGQDIGMGRATSFPSIGLRYRAIDSHVVTPFGRGGAVWGKGAGVDKGRATKVGSLEEAVGFGHTGLLVRS